MNDDPWSFYSCSTAKAIGQVMTTRRRCILAGAAAPFVFAHLPAPAQEKFVEGKHYTKLSRVQPTRDPKLVEVIEFFAYGCSHCNDFEPALDAWQKKLPRDVLFRRTPVAFRDGPMVLQQKLFLAIESLDLVDRLHHKVFEAIHSRRQRMDTPDDIGAFAESNGVDRARLIATLDSFSIAAKAKQAMQLANGYGIEGTPSLGVNGRWLTSGSQAGSNAQSLAVADHLIALERKAR